MYFLQAVLLTWILFIHEAMLQGVPNLPVEPSSPPSLVPGALLTPTGAVGPLLTVAPSVTPGMTSSGAGLTVVDPTGLGTVTSGGTLIPPSVTITAAPSLNSTLTNTGPLVSATAGLDGPGSGISIILNTQDCAQAALQCPEGYMMSFCTGCLTKCTKGIGAFSFTAFKDHMKIITAPDGTNCTTNFFSITRQGTCRLGSCVSPIFTRSSKLKLCPFGLFNC